MCEDNVFFSKALGKVYQYDIRFALKEVGLPGFIDGTTLVAGNREKMMIALRCRVLPDGGWQSISHTFKEARQVLKDLHKYQQEN